MGFPQSKAVRPTGERVLLTLWLPHLWGSGAFLLCGYQNCRAGGAWVLVKNYIVLILDQGPVALGTTRGSSGQGRTHAGFKLTAPLSHSDSEITW